MSAAGETPVRRFRVIPTAICIFAVLACQAPSTARQDATSAQAAAPAAAPKRITAVIMGDPPHFAGRFTPSIGSVPGLDSIEELVNSGTANFDQEGVLRPQLAEEVPSLDNGMWKVLPDGRMETTWKIRKGAVWHDGAPFTADDLAFTTRMGDDTEVPGFSNPINKMIEKGEVLDPSTYVVTWKGPYIGADTLFTRLRGLPLPKHILEAPYEESRSTLRDHPYWSQEFIGLGPFKLRELVNGSHLIVDAFDQYVLGRPKVDSIEVKFTPDANTLITTLLSGAAEATLGARLSVDQALQIQDSWKDGTVLFTPTGWVVAMPQFINPNPPVLLDVRLRRALQHAIDRQAIVDTILYGKTTVADTPVAPNQREYKEIQSAIVRYPYDPDRAAALMKELGYTKGSDGMLQDSARQRLTIESRTNNQLDTQVKAESIVARDWEQAGVDVDEVVYGQQRVADREYRHTRPGFEVLGFGNNPESFANFHSKQTPSAESGWLGQNRTRYQNPEYDALVDTYYVTIPRPERLEVLKKIVHHFSDQLILLPLAYTTNHVAVGNRIKNYGSRGPNSTEAWNAEQWDVAQ
jgi:peptide/nickel transport system substrate-binding protein